MRANRAHESEEQIAARNAAQQIRTAEDRRQESREQSLDERLRQNILRTRSARERHIATFRERDRERQQTNRALTRASFALRSNMYQTSITLHILKL